MPMNDQEITDYLRENGYPEHIVRAGPAGLIDRWRNFVEEVERGYKSGLEDYRKELDIRGILAMFSLNDKVRDLDQRIVIRGILAMFSLDDNVRDVYHRFETPLIY